MSAPYLSLVHGSGRRVNEGLGSGSRNLRGLLAGATRGRLIHVAVAWTVVSGCAEGVSAVSLR